MTFYRMELVFQRAFWLNDVSFQNSCRVEEEEYDQIMEEPSVETKPKSSLGEGAIPTIRVSGTAKSPVGFPAGTRIWGGSRGDFGC